MKNETNQIWKRIIENDEVYTLLDDYSTLVYGLEWDEYYNEITGEKETPKGLHISWNGQGEPILLGTSIDNQSYVIASGWKEFGGEEGFENLIETVAGSFDYWWVGDGKTVKLM